LADNPDDTIRMGRGGAWSNGAANFEEAQSRVLYFEHDGVAPTDVTRIVDWLSRP
jgi:hypothetical protein